MATITKLPSGKFRAQVRRNGTYNGKTFDRKGDAVKWAQAMETAIAGGSSADVIATPKTMTLRDVIQAYSAQVKVGRTTAANLRRISAMIGSTLLSDLSAITLRDFVTARQAEGAGGSTMAGDLSGLSGVLKWARRVRRLDVNDRLASEARSALTAARISTRSRERTRLPTEAELARVVAHLDARRGDDGTTSALVRFAALSGMRLSEITGLQIADLRQNEGAILIRQRKHPTQKASNDQVVPLLPEALELLRQAAGGRTEGRFFACNPRSVGTAFHRATRALGIEGLRFHDLRHEALTSLFRAGLPVEMVALVSGHKDWKHLKRYTNLTPADFHARLAQVSVATKTNAA